MTLSVILTVFITMILTMNNESIHKMTSKTIMTLSTIMTLNILLTLNIMLTLAKKMTTILI